MNNIFYSNIEFTDLKKRINNEILRRGTYKWFDPLTTPSVGIDKSAPLSIPNIGQRILVDEKTYTINNTSEGSLERTRNIEYPPQGENPAGQDPDRKSSIPNTSAARFDVDEIRNMLIGLAKIRDINLFYGRDEVKHTMFRDTSGIEEVLEGAEKSILNKLLHESDCSPTIIDPNGGITNSKNKKWSKENIEVTYPIENGIYVMPSGEYDGEEIDNPDGLGPNHFYDDYGARPGNSDYHPYNPHKSQVVIRDRYDQDNNRNIIVTKVRYGGIYSDQYGSNPRNPQQGNPYQFRPVYGGVITNCNNACTGLCHITCDNECSQSCSNTCWSRCGNACSSNCEGSCSNSCSSQCYTSCKTKCENRTGYSCVNAGAKAVKITTTGGRNGAKGENKIKVTTYSCDGCSFSCQFYPNKKTECWDAACMGKCFTSCSSSCSTSCYGGCINNNSEKSDGYRTGKGNGCSAGCTINCVGRCQGICEGYCVQTCWHACKQKCSDNCSWTCSTNCGSGCADGCTQSCTGCAVECSGSCTDQSTRHACNGCSFEGGCTSTCQSDCNNNCIGSGCSSMCGTNGGGRDSCESNCRMNCSGTSCTAMCSDACSDQCTTCVNTCGWQCGACSSACSTGCTKSCNIRCSATCEHSCEMNCVQSCSESCGGCSELCYSCVGMCIGVCMLKCENGCSSCANQCSWWCDNTCNQVCISTCENMCIQTCSASCISFLQSQPTCTTGPDRGPTSEGYIYSHPENRWQERESFKIIRDIIKPPKEEIDDTKLIHITLDEDKNLLILCDKPIHYDIKQTVITGAVFTLDDNGNIHIDEDMLDAIVPCNKPNMNKGGSIYIIIFTHDGIQFTDSDISHKLPFGFEVHPIIIDSKGNKLVVIQRDEFLYPIEGEEFLWGK